jgi:hypothetical protein
MHPINIMDSILKKLNINENFTKKPHKPKGFTKVYDNIPHEKNYNFMCDLLSLPTAKGGFKYCFVIVDLATKAFDIEAMKTKSAKATLDAMKAVFKRGILKKPESSISTDAGPEFEGEFHKYCYDNSIYQKVGLPDRHTQQAPVESLNKQLGRLFNGYMNSKEEETGTTYHDWTDVVGVIRTELNEFRKIDPENSVNTDYKFVDTSKPPKYKVGDVVHRLLETPRDALGHAQNTKAFRAGDVVWEKEPRKITELLYFAGKVPYRYMLEGIDKASFTEAQLKPSVEKETKYVVKEIIGNANETRNKSIWCGGRVT